MLLLLGSWLALGQPFIAVEVRGNARVPTETILYYLGSVDPDTLDSAFQRLYRTGLFEDIRFETEGTPEGSRLVVIVEEKPLLGAIRFTGETARETELRDALDLEARIGRPIGPADAQEIARAVESFLGKDYAVEWSIVPAEEGRADLELSISREERPEIESIELVGNQRVGDGELLGAMTLRPSGLLSSLLGRDRFDQQTLDADLERLRRFLRSRGYAAAVVGPAEVVTLEGGRVRIEIPVREGEIYDFGILVLEPGPLLEDEEPRDWLPPEGSRFDGAAVDRAVERLEAYYRDRGYATVIVDREERLRAERRLADVAIRVSPGPLYSVARITFEGNERHPDDELRVFLDLAEGERFNASELRAGERALMGLGNFRNVVAEVDVISTPGRAYVVYHVDEIDPFEYVVGGGLNGTEGGTGTGQFIARSVLGRAERMDVELDLGNRFQNIAASYREPSLFSRRISFEGAFRRAELTYPDDTSEDTTDFALRLGSDLGGSWRLLSGIRWSEFTLASTLDQEVPFLTPFLGERFRTYRVTAAVLFEGRDRAIFPTRGLGADLAYEWVSGDVSLHRARARGSLVIPIDDARRHLLGLSGQAEAIRPYGATSMAGVPRFERLFLGSENDLRGFSIRGVGPREGDVVVGGDRLLQASFEYLFAPRSWLRLVGFLDAGNVYATDYEGVELPALRYDAGAEARLLAPIVNVPVRIGYGVNLDPLPFEARGRFFVSLAVRF